MSRSIVRPEGWWEWVPATIDTWDVNSSEWLRHFFLMTPQKEAVIRRLTENDLLGAALMLGFWAIHAKYFARHKNWKFWFKDLCVVFLSLAMLDLLTGQLIKPMAGRLKPWRLFWDPQAQGHWSFPSAHATAAGFMIVYLFRNVCNAIRDKATAVRYWGVLYLFGLFGLFGFSAFSRILTRQHYIIDVLFGFLLGALTAWFAKRKFYISRQSECKKV